MTISFYFNLLLGFLIFGVSIAIMYITSYIIIDLCFFFSLLLETSGYINGFIIIAYILAFIDGIHFNTKDKGLRYYFEIV